MTAPESNAPKKYELSPRTQAILADKRAQTEMLARISEMNWGKGMSHDMRRALGAYLRRNGLDPREIHVLGGNLYRNGKYWLRKLSELVQADHVEYARVDHINHDPRLEEDMKNDGLPADVREKAAREMVRRREARIAYRVPEEATAACVARVKVKWLAEEVSGCKFIVMGRKKKRSDGTMTTADPVGEEFPTETVETRAWRRCLRIVASTNPALKAIEEDLRDDELGVESNLQEIATREEAREVEASARGTLAAGPVIEGLEVRMPVALTVEENLALDAELAKE